MADIPRWDLTPIYEDFSSSAFSGDCDRLRKLADRVTARAQALPPEHGVREWLTALIADLNAALDLYEELSSYAYVRFSVNTRDVDAVKGMQRVEELSLGLKRARRESSRALAELGGGLEKPGGYEYVLEELALDARYQMGRELEELAADLQRSGADAWGRLHEAVTSTARILWDQRSGETKSATELRALAFHPDRALRKRAWEKELELWRANETPLAYALNGVKGFSAAVDSRRGYASSLDYSVRLSRITPKCLDALISTLMNSRPQIGRYFSKKAALLGVERLAFYDLFAPVGEHEESWSFPDAQDFIIGQFSSFWQPMGAFAEAAFEKRWIDAPPADGKVGGAYCTHFPLSGESRILCNFEGSFSDVSTVAHELGHAFHGQVIGELPALQRDYPMTLAETASIFSETIIFQGALKEAQPRQRLAMIESFLQDASQVIIDILSRFLFERELSARRAAGEMTADELCAMMSSAQREAYGEGLDHEQLHPYMWAVKGHYYSSDLPFYNYPYAFGLLFGLGLYAQHRADPEGFPPRYLDLLRGTGNQSAVSAAASAGCDIEDAAFWQQGIDELSRLIDEFEALAHSV